MTSANALRLSLVAAAVLTGTAASSRAQAAGEGTPSIVVSYADLNLARREGVDALRHRLVAASRDVCGGGGGLAVSADYEDCRSNALQNALHDLRAAVAAAKAPGNYAVAAAAPH